MARDEHPTPAGSRGEGDAHADQGADDLSTVAYSRGARKYDAYPVQREAPSWEVFASALLKDRSPAKGLAYICAPLKLNGEGRHHRCLDDVLPRSWLALDLDGSEQGAFAELAMRLSEYLGVGWTTASHTTECPRIRVVLALSRQVDRTEGVRLGAALIRKLSAGLTGLAWDTSTHRGEQPCYLPLVSTETMHYAGEPLDVDAPLAEAPPFGEKPGKRERLEKIARADPIARRLIEQGRVKRDRGDGKLSIVCPFESSHKSKENAESSTVYMLPHFNGMKTGRFHCLHEHCAERPQAEFLSAIGLASRQLIIRRVSEVKTQAVKWLWKDRIALGKITFLVGDPDEGKSYLTAAMAAHITRGAGWPDGASCEKGAVLMISAEDDVADTIRPRLEAHKADLDRVHFLDTVQGKKSERLFSIQEDLAALSAALDEISDVRLVVIDPISAFLGNCDSHVNAEVRGLMGPFAKLAARHESAFLAISHLNKGEGNALYRITGSLAFVALARASFLLTHDKQNPERRLLLRIKNNLSPLRSGLAFSMVDGESGMPCLAWEQEPVDMTANDALAPTKKEDGETKLEAAGKWLRSELANGPVLQDTVAADAEAVGISKRTLRRAKDAVGAKSMKQKFSGMWEWCLEDAHSNREAWPPSSEPAPHKAFNEDDNWTPSGKQSAEDDHWTPSVDPAPHKASHEGGQHSGGTMGILANGEHQNDRSCGGKDAAWRWRLVLRDGSIRQRNFVAADGRAGLTRDQALEYWPDAVEATPVTTCLRCAGEGCPWCSNTGRVTP